MNDNAGPWEYREFEVARGSITAGGITSIGSVVGMARGPFGVFCLDHNGVIRGHHHRVSITHLQTGLMIAHARSGATALRVADALMEMAADFLSPMTEKHLAGLAPKVAKIVHANGALMGKETA